MRTFASLTLGTAAIAAIFAVAQPAAAEGAYVDPAPPGVASYTFEEYCREYAYRVRHPACSRFIDDSGYYNSGYYYDDNGRRHERKYRKHRHHHDRDNDDRSDRFDERDRGW